jgi:hypothetical protein
MDTRSRPPGVVRGHWGGCGLCLLLHHPQAPLPHVRSRLLPLLRRRRSTAGGCVPVHRVVPSHPVDTQSPARPPARPSQRLVLLWLLLSVPSSTPNAPGFISVANFEEVAEVQGETGSVRAYTHTHTHTHAVGALRINVRYRARRFMRTCVHARINAGITQLSLLARLLLFENPCSPESLLLARRCMWVYVFACV